MRQINKDEVSIVFSMDSHDGVILSGHCWYNKQYCYIQSNGPFSKNIEYKVYKLEGQNLINELAHRKLFEDIVGYHWTNNIKNCIYSQANSREEISLYYNNMKHIVPELNVSELELLGGWVLDNSKYWTDEDEADLESTD